MLYAGASDSFQENSLLLAHAQEVDGTWTRYPGDADTLPDSDDVVLFNTGPHPWDTDGDDYSFTGVPDLFWDNSDDVWRMWFSGAPVGNPGTLYSESADDGLTWGITSTRVAGADCWDGSAHDTGVCKFLTWNATPGDPPDNQDMDASPPWDDPGVLKADIVGDTEPELLMFATAADGACDSDAGEGQNAVTLVSYHKNQGDQTEASDSDWIWKDVVDADSLHGVVLDQSYTCPSGGTNNVNDPTPATYPLSGGGTGYMLFFAMGGSMYVSASGFECSNFQDDTSDTDTLVDYSGDTLGCNSPTDDSE